MTSHKHLGLTFDTKLNFGCYFDEISSTSRKGIGLIKHLRPFMPIKSLDQIFKMHIRSHLDYCDFIYHIHAVKSKYTHDINLTDAMNSLESLQYQLAVAVTGALVH